MKKSKIKKAEKAIRCILELVEKEAFNSLGEWELVDCINALERRRPELIALHKHIVGTSDYNYKMDPPENIEQLGYKLDYISDRLWAPHRAAFLLDAPHYYADLITQQTNKEGLKK